MANGQPASTFAVVPGMQMAGELRKAVLIVVLSGGTNAALADFTGRVVNVADGDTLTVLVDKRQIKVRLDGIDAPERGQAFGKRSQQSLAEVCAAKQAHVTDRGKDRYGRTIGRVTCAGLDANSEQLRRGMAWVFTRYVATGSPLYELEAYARARKLGLWQDQNAGPPWEWRKREREGKKHGSYKVQGVR